MLKAKNKLTGEILDFDHYDGGQYYIPKLGVWWNENDFNKTFEVIKDNPYNGIFVQQKIEEYTKDYVITDQSIGMLRQWLNEDRITDSTSLVTNEQIKHMLIGIKPVSILDQEIVICSAVIAECGTIVRGHRHHDCFRSMEGMGLKNAHKPDTQGFITSKNRFVTRKEGRKLQDLAGIKSVDKDGYRGNDLYSEDLY